MIDHANVLVIEDSPDDAELVVEALRDAIPAVEYTCVETRDGLEKAIGEHDFDLVVTDHSMPRLSSIDVVRIVRERAGDVPVILVSGKIGEEAAVAAMRAGANDYVSKDHLTLLPPAVERAIASVNEKRRRERAEEGIERIFRLAHDLIAVTDLDGRVEMSNPAWTAVLGHRPEAPSDRHIVRLVHPLDREAMRRSLDACRRGASARDLECRARDTTGEYRWLLWNVVPDLRRGLIYCVARDLTERKRAEQAVREREELLLRVVETIPDGLVMLDEEGRVTFANTAAARLGATVPGKLVERLFDDPLWSTAAGGEEGGGASREPIQVLLQNRRPRLGQEVAVLRDGGEKLHLRVNVVPLVGIGNGPIGLLLTLTDITGRRADEQALRRWGRAFEHAGWGIALVDARTHAVVLANPAFAQMHGYALPEVRGRSMDVFEGDAPPPGSPYEAVHRRKDGSTFPALVDVAHVRENGEDDADVYNVQDITRRKQAEEALRESEERWRTLVANAPAAIITTSCDGTIQFANEVAPPLASAPGTSIFDWIAQEDRDHARRLIRTLVETGEAFTHEARAYAEDATPRWYQLHASGLRRSDQVASVLLIATDVTDRRAAERKLREYREHLETMVEDRTAALRATNKELESFSYAVSHDLRAPLRGIDVYATTLEEDHGSALDDDGRDLVRRIRGEISRLKDLIAALLELSQVSGSEICRERVDLSVMADEVLRDLQAQDGGRVVETHVAKHLRASCEPRLVRTMLENLLGNAWKYTAKRDKAVIEFGTRCSGGEDCFYVRDNGAGFDAARADRLFAPFQRYHPTTEFKGTGVGLATVKRIVMRHGGRIWAESAVDHGATFYFTLSGPGHDGRRGG